MNRTARSMVVLAALLLAAAACTPSSGSLGTPAALPSAAQPTGATPTDVAPATGTPGTPPTAAPTAAPSGSAMPSATPGPSPTPGATQTTRPTTAPETMVVRAYFLISASNGQGGLAPVLRTVPKSPQVARAAMEQLLAGPEPGEPLVTAIPSGVTLNGVSITDGVATVDLSSGFDAGGGSASMFARLAQVVYTLTQFGTVDKVAFELDGEPVTMFSGEGIILDGPVGRAAYRDQLPAIFMDRPAWGASLGNPGRVSGIANVFEATFRVALFDAAGRELLDKQVMASCGTGCWGKFSTDLTYAVGKAQYGVLRVYDLSARDGTPENVVDYRVWLTP